MSPHRSAVHLVSVVVLIELGACRSTTPGVTRATATPQSAPTQATPTTAPRDTAAAERDRVMQEVLTSIAGREMMPAESVFKNIRMPGLKSVRADNFLRIMNLGYGRSLGVTCTHCHVAGNWAADDKPQKQIAREMIRMANTLTTQIRSFAGVRQTAIVNCTTCHRGAVIPATNLPAPGAGG